MTVEWSKTHPEPPPKDTSSDWYWFKRDGEKELIVMEVWPNRALWPSGLWGPLINKPLMPKKEKKNEPEENKSIVIKTETKTKRKYTRKSNDSRTIENSPKEERHRRGRKPNSKRDS